MNADPRMPVKSYGSCLHLVSLVSDEQEHQHLGNFHVIIPRMGSRDYHDKHILMYLLPSDEKAGVRYSLAMVSVTCQFFPLPREL